MSAACAPTKADELVHAPTGMTARAAIGCTIHSATHAAYETELGMPEWLARLEDQIFEGMSRTASRQFPMNLLSAIPVGFKKWDDMCHGFCVFLLRDVCRFDRKKYPDVAAAVDAVIRLHEKWADMDDQAWSAARDAARSAEEAVWPASEAARFVARSAARSTARFAARSADEAAWSVAEAARSATWSAERAAYEGMADWLVRWFAEPEVPK